MQITEKFEDIEIAIGGTVVGLVDCTGTVHVDGDFVELVELEVESMYAGKPSHTIKQPSQLINRGLDVEIFRAAEAALHWRKADLILRAANARADSRADRQMALSS